MTKTLKTPSPHMKVTRKDRLRIATHEGVQTLNLNVLIHYGCIYLAARACFLTTYTSQHVKKKSTAFAP